MNILLIILQIIVALGIFNVWLLRYGKETHWRGGTAKNMVEEFITYDLPAWFMVVIGFVKVSLAILLIIGIWMPVIVLPAAAALAILMLGAVSMHIKVKDSIAKALPATIMLLLLIYITLLAYFI